MAAVRRWSAPAAQTLDRVVASIGNVAITASDVEQEYRFERFLDANGLHPRPLPPPSPSAREHLTYQVLLTREENPGPAEKAESEKSAAKRLAALRKEFAQPEEFQRALKELGMNETELLARIAQQELVLRLIDQRLRPAASPSDDAVAEYYRSTFVPEFQKKNAGSGATTFRGGRPDPGSPYSETHQRIARSMDRRAETHHQCAVSLVLRAYRC